MGLARRLLGYVYADKMALDKMMVVIEFADQGSLLKYLRKQHSSKCLPLQTRQVSCCSATCSSCCSWTTTVCLRGQASSSNASVFVGVPAPRLRRPVSTVHPAYGPPHNTKSVPSCCHAHEF